MLSCPAAPQNHLHGFALKGFDEYKSLLRNGEDLNPITKGRIGEKQFVRDGNNRIRAIVELARETNQPIPPVVFEPSLKEITSIAQQKFEEIFNKFGNGPEAFLEIPIG